jgi:predicted ATPase
LKQLLSGFERIIAVLEDSNQPRPGLMLVSGYSGVGKSALIQELYRPITQQYGYLIVGKFDQLQRNLPYSAIVAALTDLVRQLLSEQAEKLLSWKTKFLRALGANGQIIIDIIPEFQLIVGEQPPLSTIGLAESKNRFNLVFQTFVRVCCAPEHPLEIFLDDIQWADAASLKWIKLILSDPTIQNLLVIGAYRENEITLGDQLLVLIRELQQESISIEQINLHPLNTEQVSQLVADTLETEPIVVIPLVNQIMQKTDGNPFFVNEFLKTLYSERILTFNFSSSSWSGKILPVFVFILYPGKSISSIRKVFIPTYVNSFASSGVRALAKKSVLGSLDSSSRFGSKLL